jgi:hypothetical protein
VPVLELPPPGGVKLGFGCVGRNAKHEVVVDQGPAIVRRGRTSFVAPTSRELNWARVEAESRTVGRPCGKPTGERDNGWWAIPNFH